MSQSLFGDIFQQPRIRTPKDVLEQFAQTLQIESGATLSAEIKLLNTVQNFMTFTFGIRSATTSYSYNLFAVTYGVLMYPCLINTSPDVLEGTNLISRVGYYDNFGMTAQGISTRDESDFTESIKTILTSERSKAIIRAIYSQQ